MAYVEDLDELIDRRRMAKEIGAEIEPLYEGVTIEDFRIFLGGRAMDERLRGERETRYLELDKKPG